MTSKLLALCVPLLSLDLSLGRLFYVSLDAGAGGRMFRELDEGIVHRLDLQAVLSFGYGGVNQETVTQGEPK